MKNLNFWSCTKRIWCRHSAAAPASASGESAKGQREARTQEDMAAPCPRMESGDWWLGDFAKDWDFNQQILEMVVLPKYTKDFTRSWNLVGI